MNSAGRGTQEGRGSRQQHDARRAAVKRRRRGTRRAGERAERPASPRQHKKHQGLASSASRFRFLRTCGRREEARASERRGGGGGQAGRRGCRCRWDRAAAAAKSRVRHSTGRASARRAEAGPVAGAVMRRIPATCFWPAAGDWPQPLPGARTIVQCALVEALSPPAGLFLIKWRSRRMGQAAISGARACASPFIRARLTTWAGRPLTPIARTCNPPRDRACWAAPPAAAKRFARGGKLGGHPACGSCGPPTDPHTSRPDPGAAGRRQPWAAAAARAACSAVGPSRPPLRSPGSPQRRSLASQAGRPSGVAR